MSWIKDKLNEWTGATARMEVLEAALRAHKDTYAETAQARDSWYRMALASEKSYCVLRLEMASARLTKSQLDEQAAIQLEMDEHRVELEQDLADANQAAIRETKRANYWRDRYTELLNSMSA